MLNFDAVPEIFGGSKWRSSDFSWGSKRGILEFYASKPRFMGQTRVLDKFDYRSNQTRTVQVICPWIRKFAIFDFVHTLASANIDQSVPNLVKMYVTIRSQMILIMDLIWPELSELFALEFAKIAESDFVYTLASTNVEQWVPNMVTIYMTMRSWMSSIMGQIRQ